MSCSGALYNFLLRENQRGFRAAVVLSSAGSRLVGRDPGVEASLCDPREGDEMRSSCVCFVGNV